MAKELDELANKVVDFAKGKAEQDREVALQEMSSAERNSLVIGFIVALVLVVTCVFSVFTIAKPMQALTRAMRELANGNFSVLLPGPVGLLKGYRESARRARGR